MRSLRFSRLLPAVALGTGAVLACGSGGDGGYDLTGSSWRGASASPDAQALVAQDRLLLVPPDLAVVAVQVDIGRPSAAEASSALRAEAAAIAAAVGERCTLSWVDASPATRTGGSSWRSTAELRLDVDLAELPDVVARLDKVEACLGTLDPRLTGGGNRKAGGGEDSLQRSAPVYTLRDPARSFSALVARQEADFQRAVAIQGAPQWHPGDQRCVPTGAVHTGLAQVSGVVVSLEMDCRVSGTSPPPAATAEDY